VYKRLSEKPGRNDLLGRPTLRREYNTEINVTEVGCESVDWIRLA
jgi:hypothetical protein